LPALGVPQVQSFPPFSLPPTVQVPPVNVIPAGVVGLASAVAQSCSHLPAVTLPATHVSALETVYPALHVSVPVPPLDRVPVYAPMAPPGFVEPAKVTLAVVVVLTAALISAAVQAFAVHAKLLPAAPAAGVTPLIAHVLVPPTLAVYPVLQVGVHVLAVEPPPNVLVQSPTAPLVGTALKSHVFSLQVTSVSLPAVHDLLPPTPPVKV
jgi:hypothetical protein